MSGQSPPGRSWSPIEPRGTGGPHWVGDVVQVVEPDGVLDLGPGFLDPVLLPTGPLETAYAQAFARYGPAALAYGNNHGPLALRAALAARTVQADGLPCAPEQIVVTAGTSSALDLLARSLGRPGDVVLTESLSYDLARRIFTDRGLLVRGVPMDGSGLDPSALGQAAATMRSAGRRVAFVYLLPTFHNPTGELMPRRRRLELLSVARRHELLILEDDAYRDLGLEPGTPVPSVAGLAGYQGVIRLCTTSKSLAPGLRLGWLVTGADLADQITSSGLFASGGGLNHLAALAAAGLYESGGYDRHLAWLRVELRARRDALVGTLRTGLPSTFRFQPPGGGFFLWVRLPSWCAEAEMVDSAARAGVRVAAGSRFGRADGPAVRLCFSFHDPQRLTEAANRLASAWRGAAGVPSR